MSEAVRRYGWALELLTVRNVFEGWLHETWSGASTQAFQAETRKLLPEVDRLLVSREADAVDRAAKALEGLCTRWEQVRAKTLEAATRLKREADSLLSRGASAPSYLMSMLKGTLAGGCLGSVAGCSVLGLAAMALSTKASGTDLGLLLGGLAGLAVGALWQRSKSPLKEVFAGLSRLHAEAPDVVATARDMGEAETAAGLDPLMAWRRPVDLSGLIAKGAGVLGVIVLLLWALGGLVDMASGLFSRRSAAPPVAVAPPPTRAAAPVAKPAAPARDWTGDAAAACGLAPVFVQTGAVANWERGHVADAHPTGGGAARCTDALSIDDFAASPPEQRCVILQIWNRNGIAGPCRSRQELQAAGRTVEGDDPLGLTGASVVQERTGVLPCLTNWTREQWEQLPAGLQRQVSSFLQTRGLAGPCAVSSDTAAPATAASSAVALEAEAAELGGSAKVNREHSGFSDAGYVDGYGYRGGGASTTFALEIPAGGSYDVALRYANATGRTMTLSLYVNGTKVRQARLPAMAQWSDWGDAVERLNLPAGHTSIAYRYDLGDTGSVNLDRITVSPAGGESSTSTAALPGGGPTLAGRWEGRTVEGWRSNRMRLTLRPESGSYSGTAEYSNPCQTVLSPHEVADEVYRLSEKVTSGRCMDTFLDLRLEGEVLQLAMVDPRTGRKVGRATLTRTN